MDWSHLKVEKEYGFFSIWEISASMASWVSADIEADVEEF